jgi:hypothetical protein
VGRSPRSQSKILAAPAVVLVGVNLIGNRVLLLLDDGAVGGGQLAIVELLHIALFVIDGCFFLLEASRLAGGQLAALDALSDAILLIFLAV